MTGAIAKVVCAAGTIVLCLVSACQPREPRAIYLVPNGYVGWICVHYGVPDAPPLTKEGRFSVLSFDADGVVRTSDHGKPGTGYEDQFFYVAGTERKAIPSTDIGGGGTFGRPSDPQYRYVFFMWIGADRARFRPAIADSAPDKGPSCGPA